MDINYKELQELKVSALTDAEANKVEEFKNQILEMLNENDVDVFAFHTFIHLYEEGLIVVDKNTLLDVVLAMVREGLYGDFDNNIDFYYLVNECPLCVKYIPELKYKLSLSELMDIGFEYYSGECLEKNDKLYFEFMESGANFTLYGMIGGFTLVDTLIRIDNCRVLTADCYMDGIGTEKNLIEAFWCLYHTNRDHLTQKNEADLIEDRFDKLFALLKADEEKGNIYPGLYFVLAMMYKEGLGTDYNYKEYMRYLAKEESLDYQEDIQKLVNMKVNTINNTFEPIKKVKHITDELKKGDYVSYGKYNKRNVLWKVINVDDNGALLLANDVIESSYVASAHNHSKKVFYEGFLNYKFLYDFENYEEDLVETDRGYAFLLNVDEVHKYLRMKKSRFCGATPQAKINGYDEYGLDMDEYSDSAPWWIAKNDQTNDDEYQYYVDQYGEIYNMNRADQLIGIRPAILVKKK